MEKNNNSIRDISNSTVSNIVQGTNNHVRSNLNDSGKDELAKTLKALTDAVMVSAYLSDEQKEGQIKIINQIGEEAATPKPNKSYLKTLSNVLLTALQTAPDVTKAVKAVVSTLNQLHL